MASNVCQDLPAVIYIIYVCVRVHSALKIGVRGTFCARPICFSIHGCFSFKKL